MLLPNPVTIAATQATLPSGAVINFPAVTLTELDVTLIDNAKARKCSAFIRGARRPLVLWQGNAYDAAGDYTQVQAEARLTELLAPDWQENLAALFAPPSGQPR